MKALAAGLLRAVVLAVIPAIAYDIYATRFYDGIGADIGGALMMFMVLALGAFLWSWFDTDRRGLRPSVVIWAWAGVGCFATGAVDWMIHGDLDGVGPVVSSGAWYLFLLAGGAAAGLTTERLIDRSTTH